jgi:hypothetical protein
MSALGRAVFLIRSLLLFRLGGNEDPSQATNSSIANVCEASANDGADEAQEGTEDAETDEPLQNFGASTPILAPCADCVEGLD